ncbi:MAG TPA: ECF-type sigma factor [Thermoanaerobaculia bacterium]|nr:ECF-type sigma factor [Thermoanaerobaculia bacterium]
MSDADDDITRLLNEAKEGREGALDEVTALVYDRLRALARTQARRYRGAGTSALEPTELVHEAFLRLVKQRKRYDSRGHFFTIATRVMLRILLDRHRAKGRLKRGGGQLRVTLTAALDTPGEEPSMVIPAFVESLERLEALDARCAEVAKLRVLWGLTVTEVAAAMELSVSTVEREWRFARRWLSARLDQQRAEVG